MKILDGKKLAAWYHQAIKREVESMCSERAKAPGLAVVLVGDNPASKVYVKNKERVARDKCGFETFNYSLPSDASLDSILETIDSLNDDPAVDGILLQLPLPKRLDSAPCIDRILTVKDVDGLHPYNQGLLFRGEGTLRPCTPLGVLSLIDLAHCNCEINDLNEEVRSLPPADLAGKRAIVIGRSILVGKPLVGMLLERNATVTAAHSKTPNLSELCAEHDIVVAAVGVPELVRGEWIKPGAIVIDVGINRTDAGTLVGDVCFDEALLKASALTPVPGGVGPMTIAMLMKNTLLAAQTRSY